MKFAWQKKGVEMKPTVFSDIVDGGCFSTDETILLDPAPFPKREFLWMKVADTCDEAIFLPTGEKSYFEPDAPVMSSDVEIKRRF